MLLRSPLALFFFTLFLCAVTVGGHLYSPDEEIMFRVTESLATRGQLDVDPIRDPSGGTFATKAGLNGREYAQYGAGNSLFAVPFYWAGSLACRFVSDARAEALLHFSTNDYIPDNTRTPGHDRLKRFFVSWFGALVAAATVSLLWLFSYGLLSNGDDPENDRRNRRVAGLVALSYIVGTMAWPHARTFFSEPLATFFSLLSFYFVATGGGALTSRRALLGGAAYAAALFTRLDSALVAPGLGLLLLARLPVEPNLPEDLHDRLWVRIRTWLMRRATWDGFECIINFCIPPLAFVGWYFAMNHVHFGDAFTTAYEDQSEGVHFSTPILAGLYGFFMSIGKSMILFSPALLLGFAGFRRFVRRWPYLGWAVILVVAIKILVHSRWQNWPGGWCWGPRHIFLVHAFIMLPSLAFFHTITLSKRIFADAALLAGTLVQLYGCSQNFIDFYLLYYRTPMTPPIATVMYAHDDTAPNIMRLLRANPQTGQFEPISFGLLVAPINDSIYVPQNSQWYKYAEMWNMGYTDNLWLRLLQRSQGKEAILR